MRGNAMPSRRKSLTPIALGAVLVAAATASSAEPKQLFTQGQRCVHLEADPSVLRLDDGHLTVVTPREGGVCRPLALVKVADLSRAGAPWSIITTAAVMERSVTAGQATCTGVVTPDDLAGVLRPRANVVAWAEAGPGDHWRTESLALRNNCDSTICRLVAVVAPAGPNSGSIEPCPDTRSGAIGETIELAR
jgi:hypothetical protein